MIIISLREKNSLGWPQETEIHHSSKSPTAPDKHGPTRQHAGAKKIRSAQTNCVGFK